MINEAIAALVFVSLIWISSLVSYAKEHSNLNGWLVLWNAVMVAVVTYELLRRLSL